MRDWRTELRESDPARDAEMSAADVQRVRSVVLAAAHTDGPAGFAWPRAFVATTAALTLTCTLALVALQRSGDEMRRQAAAMAERAPESGSDADPVVQKQQLQFATPGGTRIIWVFDSEFEVKGTLP